MDFNPDTDYTADIATEEKQVCAKCGVTETDEDYCESCKESKRR